MKWGLVIKAFLLLLYLTGLFRFTAYALGVPLSSFEQISFGLFLLSSIFYLQYSVKLLRKKVILLWVLAHFIIPLLTMFFQIRFNYIEVGDVVHWSLLNLYFFTIFFFSASFGYQYSFRTVKRVCSIALIIAIVGFIINYTYPVLFKGTALMYGINAFLYKSSFERAFGFYLQENVAGLSLITLFAVIMSGIKRKGVLRHLLLLILLTFLVSLTGSRSSLFIIAIFFLFTLMSNYTYLRKKCGLDIYSSQLSVILIYGGMIVTVLIATSIGANYLLERNYVNLGSRINILAGNVSFDNDSSILGRVQALRDYIPYILENPFLGYGPTYDDSFLAMDVFHKSSHNNFVQIAFEHGIFGLMALLIAIIYSYRLGVKTKSHLFFNFHTLEIMVIIILFNGMFFLKLIKVRELLVVFGMIVGAILQWNDSRKRHFYQSTNLAAH